MLSATPGVGILIFGGLILLAAIIGIIISFLTNDDHDRPGQPGQGRASRQSTSQPTQSISANTNEREPFQHSGWVTGFRILGWLAAVICIGCLISGLSTGSEEDFFYALINFMAANTFFFKAHLLWTFEKGVHHAESIDSKLSQSDRK